MNEGAVALKVNAAAEGFRAAAGPSASLGHPTNTHGVPNRLPRLASLSAGGAGGFNFQPGKPGDLGDQKPR